MRMLRARLNQQDQQLPQTQQIQSVSGRRRGQQQQQIRRLSQKQQVPNSNLWQSISNILDKELNGIFVWVEKLINNYVKNNKKLIYLGY